MLRCSSLDRAAVFAAVLAAATVVGLFAAPCERPLPPCTPAGAPYQR